jgi:phosphoribosyl-dephospho-CoA transferase
MRPHDLLRLTPAATFADDDAPDWVAPSLAHAPFVVVRRAAHRNERISVGIRGTTRAQRHPAWMRRADVAEVITPERLAAAKQWRSARALPAIRVLERVAGVAAALNLVWGPAGSVGFELASGVPVVGDDSDLDIVVRPDTRHGIAELANLRDRCVGADVRIDVVIETDRGAVALDEWLQSPDRVLIKTVDGPQLSAFSW